VTMDVDTTRVIDRLTRTAPFGVRFWDVVRRDFVRSGLSMTVFEVGNSRKPVEAFPNHSGVWMLRGLGLRHDVPATPPARPLRGDDFEFGDGRQAFWDAWPVPEKQYDFTVVDREDRFQPFRFRCGAPQRGFARCGCGLMRSPADPACPEDAVPLYPSSAYLAPPGMAVVRAQLEELPVHSPAPDAGPRWAAWAYVEVWIDGRLAGASFADRHGRVGVMFPWPTPSGELLLSPPSPLSSGGALALVNQRWRVELRAFYDQLPAGASPEVCRVLAQQPAALIGRVPDEPLTVSELHYGRELVIRSHDDRLSPPALASSVFIRKGS